MFVRDAVYGTAVWSMHVRGGAFFLSVICSCRSLVAPSHRVHGRRRVVASSGEEIEVVLHRPLGVTVQEVSGAVVIQSCQSQAQEAGVKPGDEIVGVSAIFGDDVWSTRGAGLDQGHTRVLQ